MRIISAIMIILLLSMLPVRVAAADQPDINSKMAVDAPHAH